MLLFVVFVTFYCEQVESLGFSDPVVQGAYLQQFGYQSTTERVPTGINVLPERIKSGKYEDIGFRAISPDTIRKLQQYAGVEQTGVFDNATIGMMMTARCQNPDIMDDTNRLTKFFLGKKSRAKRDAVIGGSIGEWEKLDLTFAFESTTPQNSQAQEVISSAFAAWSECSKLSFKMVDLLDSPDIKVKFASGLHEPPANCEFDGPEGVKAHAFYPPLGMAHFDEDEDWTDNCVLYTVALHEIGHLLGLGHSFYKTSIMFAYFNAEFVKSQCQRGTRLLANNDINNIRALYGAKSCDKAEDVVTEGPTLTSPTVQGHGQIQTGQSETTSAIQMTTNTPSGSQFLTHVTDSWQLACGEMEENILTSPYYPEVYPNGMNCTWNVRAPPGMRAVSMHFIRFEVEDGGEECIYDYLQVTLEDGTSQKLCGSQTKSLTFESKSLTVNFVSDVLKQEAGFRILFTYEAESPKPPCRIVVVESEGLLTQEHPKLDNHEECTYHINSTDPNKQILIIIEDIAQHCSKYELLLSEDNEEKNLIGSCSEDSSGLRYFVSTSGSFFIKFRPQNSVSFAIKYYTIFADSWKRCSSSGARDYNQEFVKSGRWSPKIQNINNAEKYFLNTDCILHIPRNTEGKELTVKLDNLDIEYDKYCSYDFLEVYAAGDNRTQRYCGQDDRIEFTTFGDTLIYFHSDYSVEGTAFVLEYGVTECVHDLPDSRESANKISDVSLEGDCSYSFEMVANKHFVCAEFAAEGGCKGYVAVGASGARHCKPFSTVLEGNEAVNISPLSSSQNYSMKYVTIDSSATNCYRIIQVTSMRDRGYPFKPPRDKLCAVHLIGKAGYQLVMTFIRVSLKQHCQSDLEYIKVFTGNNGCHGERRICSTQGNADIRLQSQDAYVLSYLTDRKSTFKLLVRLESQKVPTSFCPKSCGQGSAITDVTVEPASTSSYRTSPDVASFRLVDGDGNNISGAGRGLLLYKGGTVCDDYFDDNAADAICKEMGYDESESWQSSTPYSYSSFQDSLDINLDDVNCRNGSWSSCSYSETHNCAHREDVFLACNRLVPTSEPTVQYTITYSIWDDRNARTQNPQYVTIKGTNGETEEQQCDADFNVINQDVLCVFDSDVNIGDYRCVSLRTGGSDGLDLIQIKVQIDGTETHTIVPKGNADYIGLDDGQTKEFCLAGTATDSCWKDGSGSYPSSYKLEQQQFVDYTSCQLWCDEDEVCAAVVVSSGLCVKLATEDISPLAGSQAALKDCWEQTFTVTATTTVIRDDSAATANCGVGYRAVDCYSNYPMSSVLDGVIINQQSCYVSMSFKSKQNVDVTATCRKEKTCPTNNEISKYKYIKQDNWVTGSSALECPSGYELFGCYITSAWSPEISFRTFETGAKTTGSACSFTDNTRYKLSAVCRVIPSYWDENSCTINWTIKVICDDQMNLWIDGELTEVAGQGAWNQLSTLSIPESTRSIGVKCKNNGGPYGIIGSIQDADGNDVLVTDNSWSCSNTADEGWERPDFVESDNWNAASYYRHRDYITDGGPWKEISANSQIIWTAAAADTTVYCRKVLQQEQEMLTIASSEMKNSWRAFPPAKLVDGNLNNFAHSAPEEDGMWVRVNLLQPSLVTKVVIYNRQDCCKDRIVGASAFIKSGEEYVTDCGTINSVRDSYQLNCIGEGDTIELKQDGKVGSWNIAEIQVYGTHDDESNPGRSNKNEIFRLVDRNGDAVTSGERGLLIYNGGTVCDDGFGDLEAGAICRELGHGGTASWESGPFYQDFQETLEIRLDNVNCVQQTWSSCSYLESHNCGHSEDVFLTCPDNDETISFVIVDENRNTGSNSGLLLYNGGTVCDDSFNENSAEAICTILGFESGESEWSSGSLWEIQSDYNIALDDVRCQDGSWFSCTYSESHNCGHSEDVFLSCGVGGD